MWFYSTNIRQGSIGETTDNEASLKISNYEYTVQQLDIYYGIGKQNIYFSA
jgi:hypothetical protein